MNKLKTPNRPPRWPDKLLERFCTPHLLEEVLGDLHERHYLSVKKVGEARARMQYWREVLAYIRPSIFKRQSTPYSKPIFTDMLRNYFITAVRNMVRYKAYSVINSIGMALGMASFFFIILWVRDENGIDNFHKNGKYLYNVYETVHTNGQVTASFNTPFAVLDGRRYNPLADVEEAVPEVKDITFYATGDELPWEHPETFQVGEKKYKLSGSRAGKDFF